MGAKNPLDSQGQSGFRFSQLLRRDQVPDDDCNYMGNMAEARDARDAEVVQVAQVWVAMLFVEYMTVLSRNWNPCVGLDRKLLNFD